MISVVLTDGGREAAGFRGYTGDCVTRAIAIVTDLPYKMIYDDLWQMDRDRNGSLARGPRQGVPRKLYEPYLESLGYQWVPTMRIGQGCTTHLRSDELPNGRLIVRLSRHVAAVIDGVLYDNHDSSRGGTRCVYGYFKEL